MPAAGILSSALVLVPDTYRIGLSDFGVHVFVLGCHSDLQGDLYEGSREVVDHDDLAQCGLQKRLEVAFSRSYIVPEVSVRSRQAGQIVPPSCVPPTPAAGRTITSTTASSGSSSLLWTSMGPLTAPMTV
jgi:hypothetical protein